MGSDHLPIDITIQLAPICHFNTGVPAFNFKAKNLSLITLPSLSRKTEYSLRSSLLLLTPLKRSKDHYSLRSS